MSVRSTNPSWPGHAVTWHRPWLWLALAVAGVTVVGAVGLLINPRIFTGAPLWAKPLKVSISIVVYSLTLFVSLVLLPIVYVLSMIWAWWHRGAIRAKSGGFGRFSLWFPLLTTLVGAWVILDLVPRLFGPPLANIRVFAPDFGLALIATAVTGPVGHLQAGRGIYRSIRHRLSARDSRALPVRRPVRETGGRSPVSGKPGAGHRPRCTRPRPRPLDGGSAGTS